MYDVEVTVEGTAPLLQRRHAAPADTLKEIDLSSSLYRTREGLIGQPTDHFMGCLLKAANDLDPVNQKKNNRALIKEFVFIEDEVIPHLIQEFEEDGRYVNITMQDHSENGKTAISKRKVWRKRPKLNKWKLAFILRVLSDEVSSVFLEEALNRAGVAYGIGDNRPKFGRFKVTRFKVTERRDCL